MLVERETPNVEVATVLWCPKHLDERAAIITTHLDQLMEASRAYVRAFTNQPKVYLLDNCVEHPEVLAKIEQLAKYHIVQHVRFTPQIGWARARNYAMECFMQSDPGPLSRLVMTDCDQHFDNNDWLIKVWQLALSDTYLHAYMIRPDKEQLKATVRLSTKTVVDVYSEWLGTTNVVSPEAITRVGGYDYVTFPAEWGFHDCEWGRRLNRAGVLEATHGRFVDAVRVPGKHPDSPAYNTALNPLKLDAIRRFNHIFIQQESAINNGRAPLFFPYKYADEGVDVEWASKE